MSTIITLKVLGEGINSYFGSNPLKNNKKELIHLDCFGRREGLRNTDSKRILFWKDLSLS